MTVIFRWARTVPHPPISFGTRGISADLSQSVITDLECELEWLTSGASTRPVCPPRGSPRHVLNPGSVRRPSAGEKPLPCGATRSEAVGRREPGTAGVPGDSTRGTDGRTGTDLSAGSHLLHRVPLGWPGVSRARALRPRRRCRAAVGDPADRTAGPRPIEGAHV